MSTRKPSYVQEPNFRSQACQQTNHNCQKLQTACSFTVILGLMNYFQGHLQLSAECNPELLRFCNTSLCDWSKNLAPLPKPIRYKTVLHSIFFFFFLLCQVRGQKTNKFSSTNPCLLSLLQGFSQVWPCYRYCLHLKKKVTTDKIFIPFQTQTRFLVIVTNISTK